MLRLRAAFYFREGFFELAQHHLFRTGARDACHTVAGADIDVVFTVGDCCKETASKGGSDEKSSSSFVGFARGGGSVRARDLTSRMTSSALRWFSPSTRPPRTAVRPAIFPLCQNLASASAINRKTSRRRMPCANKSPGLIRGFFLLALSFFDFFQRQ